MSALVVTFLSHLDVPNASALVFKTLQKGTLVVQTLMLDQLRDAEADMHILKASQISVNSAVSLFILTADRTIRRRWGGKSWEGSVVQDAFVVRRARGRANRRREEGVDEANDIAFRGAELRDACFVVFRV